MAVRWGVSGLGIALACTSAFAADKPLIAPAPAWVKPLTLAKTPEPKKSAFVVAPTGGDETGGAVRVLLNDQQVQFEAGRTLVYTASMFRIQTPQGLAAGNVNFAWQPDTDTVTVHKLMIRHADGSLVDVLASGQSFTVLRRESNLESAMLDGVLTANIQPEGLQVGDTVEFAMTVSSSDPVLKGHVEFVGGGWNGLPVDRAHLKVAWAAVTPVRVQASAAIPAPKIVRGNAKAGTQGGFDIELAAIEPVLLPRYAPPRYRIGRLVEVSDFASWADLSALLAPLYDKAAILPAKGPLADEAAKIKAVSVDPVVRAQAVLALVEDRVRYVALLMGAGALTPSDAETTWGRRFGDCKAKTALLVALLRDMGIKADPLLVNAFGADGLDERLPMVGLFNHVIVRAEIAGKTYFLDGTRTGDRRLDQLEVPDLGWGLPVVASGGALVRLLPPPLVKPTEVNTIRIDAHDGISLPAPTTIDGLLTGDAAYGTSLAIGNLAPDARDRALRDYWKKRYDFLDVKSATFAYDADKREARFRVVGESRMEWKDGWYRTDGTDVGYRIDFARDPGPDKDAPYQVAYPFHVRNIETIILPDSFKGYPIPAKWQVDQTASGIEYRRNISMEGTTFHAETSQRSIVPEIPAKDAPAAQAALRVLSDNDVYLRKPDGYRLTDKELALAITTRPDSAEAYVERGNMFSSKGRFIEAIADFTQALVLDPANEKAYAFRALANMFQGKQDAAAKDSDAALRIDPHNGTALLARGMIAVSKDNFTDAITAFTAALDATPGNPFILGHRARAYQATGDARAAFADANIAIKGGISDPDLYLIRANALRRQGDTAGVVATAAALAAANPDNGYAHVTAARIYERAGKRDDAMREFDRAIALKPESYVYLNRADSRAKADIAGRRADVDFALKLDPKSEEAVIAKARLEQEAGNASAAALLLSKLPANASSSIGFLVERGTIYALTGDKAKAEQDFATARSKAKMAADFNSICFTKAKAGVALTEALADCDIALAKEPDSAAIIDSRAFTLLRLGRYDDAIAGYDRALTKLPNLADSLLGRAMAWAKKGDKAKSDVDRAAALRNNPDIEELFATYGLKL